MNNVIKAILTQNTFTATEFQDIARHGADGGFSGFIYYTETETFYDANEDLINEELQNYRNENYDDETTMIQILTGFGRGGDLEVVTAEFEYDEEEGEYNTDTYSFECEEAVLWESVNYDNCEMEGIAKDTAYKNLMAWFILEEGARMIEQMIEDGEIEEVKAMGIDCSELEEQEA